MNREQKAAEIESLKNRFSKAQIAILVNNKGLNVSDVTDLRRKLREKSSSFKVVKNRLAKIALKGTPFEVLTDYLKNTTAVATSEVDLVGPAKVLTDFVKNNEKLELKIGILDGKVINIKDIQALANMPSKEELIAKMLGSLNAPATNLVNVLIQIPRQLVQVLAAVKDHKEKNA